jgi:hypothetical protein
MTVFNVPRSMPTTDMFTQSQRDGGVQRVCGEMHEVQRGVMWKGREESVAEKKKKSLP